MVNSTLNPMRKIFFSSVLLILATFSYAQNGSQCYKPFSGVGKVPTAIQGGLLCVGCASSNDLSNLVDADITNSVDVSTFVGLTAGGGVSVRDTASDTPAGHYAGYVVGITPGLLTANVLDAITVSTYNNGVLQQSVSGNSLAYTSVTGSGMAPRTYVYFQTTTTFDEIRFTYASVVGLLTTVDVFYAMAFDPNCGNNENNGVCADAIQGPGTFVTNPNSIVCVLCTVINPDNLVDANKDNFAVLSTPAAALATSSVGVLDEQNIYPAGSRAGFIISPDQAATLLDANLLNAITIETYLFGTLQEQQTFNAGGGGLVSLTVLSGGLVQKAKLGFVTTLKFNEVRIRVNQLAGASLGGLRIYGAFEEPAACTDCETPLVSTAPSPYTGSLVAGNISPFNPWTGVYGLGLHNLSGSANIVDGDLTNFATYNSLAGLLSTGINITVENDGPLFATGTFGGFVIEKDGALLNVNVLNAITVSLYNGTTLVSSQTGVALLPAGVLNTSTGRTVVGLKATAPFNRIRINIDNGLLELGLGGAYHIYYAFVQLDSDNDGTPDCIDNCVGNNALDNDGDGIPDACDNCNVGTAAPAPGADTFLGACIINTANLTGITTNNMPAGAQLTVHTGTPATTGNKLVNITAVPPGTYYLAFFDPVNNCYGKTRLITVLNTVCPAQNPLPEADHTATLKNTAVTGSVKTNDTDPQGSALTYNTTASVAPANGNVTIAANGDYTYTPNTGFVGVDSFRYVVCNIYALCSTAWVYISVTNPRVTGGNNNPPLAQTDYTQTLTGVPATGNAASNDFDPDNNTLSWNLINNASNGNVIVLTDGNYTYFPNPGFNGNDTARYRVCDNGTPSKCDTALIIFSIKPDTNGPANNPPFAQNDVAATPAGMTVGGNALNNDFDPNGDILTTAPIGPLPTGFVLGMSGGFVYTPPPGFTGTIKVPYQACDGSLCDTATITIVVFRSLAIDLTLSSRVSSTGFNVANQQENTIVLDVSEILGGTTNNTAVPIQVRIFKSDNFMYSFDPLQTAANAPGVVAVNNPNWALTTNNSTVMVFTMKPGKDIDGNSFSSIAVKLKVVTGASKGTSNFNATIIGGSGNETDVTNNQVVRILNIF